MFRLGCAVACILSLILIVVMVFRDPQLLKYALLGFATGVIINILRRK
jgi:hypothetical protein